MRSKRNMYAPNIQSVGYWRYLGENARLEKATVALPDPAIRNPPYTDEDKAKFVAYLNAPTHTRVAFRGASECRICGCHNGCEDVSDGTWRWPSGLAHYVQDHDVALPLDFILHIRRAHG